MNGQQNVKINNAIALYPVLDETTQTYLKDYLERKKVQQSHYRPEVPRGFQEVKVPILHDNGTGWW